MIFYPQDWWHQTINTQTPTMTASGTALDENNYRDISRELKAECQTKKFKWDFSKALCEELDKCHELWANRWDTSRHRDLICPIK